MEPHIRDVTLRGDQATGHDDRNVAFSVMLPHDPAIATRLAQNHVAVVIAPAEDQNWLTTLLVNGLPLLAYLFLTTWPLFRVSRSLDTLAGRFERRAERRPPMKLTQGQFSFLPDLTDEEISAQVQYAPDNEWSLAAGGILQIEHRLAPHRPIGVARMRVVGVLDARRTSPASSWCAPKAPVG